MDTQYALKFGVESPTVASKPALISYSVRKGEEIISELATVHEWLSHLIIVSEDLSYFDHVHADFSASTGLFSLKYTFPKAGTYILFADFTPRETDSTQVERLEIQVQEHPSGTKQPPADDTEAENIAITQKTLPETLKSNRIAQLIYRIEDADGEPVNDVQPFLGAPGHLVIISDDTQTFLHVHPLDGAEHHTENHADHTWHPTEQNPYFGPEIVFHTHVTAPGDYRVWLEIKRHGRQHRRQFTLNIKP